MTALRFEIVWEGEASGSPAEATRGQLVVWFGDRVVWGRRQASGVAGIDWTWIDFLDHVSRVWMNLCWKPYPLGLSPLSPADFAALATERLLQSSGANRESQEMEVWGFTESHDLSHALGGIDLPSLWLYPEGEVVSVAGRGFRDRVAWSDSMGMLEKFCDSISARLAAIAHPQAKSVAGAWARRAAEPDPVQTVALYTGRSEAEVEEIAGNRPAAKAFGLSPSFRPNELLALSRATCGIVSSSDLRDVFEAVRAAPAKTSKDLTSLTAELDSEALSGRPHEQGWELAQRLRNRLGNLEAPINVSQLLSSWNVSVESLELETDLVDALAVWGPKYGPLVIINSKGKHNQTSGARNATLAHEICHLLVDRQAALPLAEALGGLVPPDLEARARAFAAEFLAPGNAVRSLFEQHKDPERAVTALMRHFKVGSELIAWQVKNAETALTTKAIVYLRSLVSRPHEFF